jgi:hypothetical protein
MTSSRKGNRHEGHYDVRSGAVGYAPIVGTLGALAVPAVIVLFTARPVAVSDNILVTLAAGFLVVSMIGSIIGAISLAAIGGETEATPNLPPAIMFAAVPVVIALVNFVAAFEVLAALYLPQAKVLLAVITAAVGALGVFFTALALGDSWSAVPPPGRERKEWKKRKQWITKQKEADKAAIQVVLIGVVPALTGLLTRLARLEVAPSNLITNCIVGAGLVLSVLGTIASALRTAHPIRGYSDGVYRWEAYATTLTTSAYTLAVLIFLP